MGCRKGNSRWLSCKVLRTPIGPRSLTETAGQPSRLGVGRPTAMQPPRSALVTCVTDQGRTYCISSRLTLDP